ncbi:hypothetical protein MAR_030369 [Mya arenaria]|uniref:Uncharacterized protein n=1 Tax=Mya arenaria TaxID=6604 RepID=A0ABY7DJ09_MYAAR|nr:hypothetical protein MAR_030369 [Mya arenaria]
MCKDRRKKTNKQPFQWPVRDYRHRTIGSSGLQCTVPDVSLPNEHTSVMDTLCKPNLEHLGLQTTFQEVFYSQT